MVRSILVVDDEEAIRSSLAGVLSDEGFKVHTVSDGKSALDYLSNENPDVILLDVWMTGPTGERQQEGLEVLEAIKKNNTDSVVIIMSGHGSIETAVRATKLGAYDFVEKPLSLEKLLVTLQNAFRLRDLARENKSLRSRVQSSRVIIGKSQVMQQVQSAVKRVAKANSWVLITGENGTGKELVAHAIHAQSSRYDKPFVEVNCAAIPEDLIESELFGHEKGSFTGATQKRRGKFDLANQGTLFLDEIADMSLKTQAKVLRILQEQRFERVGGSQTIEVDVRVIAATNKDLEEEIRNNRFREDLYYRLNVVPVVVPPLRDRKDDIPHLVDYFFKEYASPETEPFKLSDESLELFQSYQWPGNVRELKNTIERLVIFADEKVIRPETLLALIPDFAKLNPSEVTNPNMIKAPVGSLKDAKNEFEREFILTKLKENEWNVSRTAQALGIERSHLHKKIKNFGIDAN